MTYNPETQIQQTSTFRLMAMTEEEIAQVYAIRLGVHNEDENAMRAAREILGFKGEQRHLLRLVNHLIKELKEWRGEVKVNKFKLK